MNRAHTLSLQMASNSEHHQVPVIGQSGHWGQYQIPRAPPGLAHMQAHPPALPIPVLGNLQAHPAVQPMETAEHGVQHPGYNYQPIPAIVTSGRQHETGTFSTRNKTSGDSTKLGNWPTINSGQLPSCPPPLFPRECRKYSCTFLLCGINFALSCTCRRRE